MENFFRSKEYWSLVKTGIPAVAEGTDPTYAQKKIVDDQRLKDLKAKNYLFQAIWWRLGSLTIANKMRIHGEQMGDIVVIEKILRSMTPKYDYVVCSIEESNDLDTLSIDELQSSLLVHEQRMGRHAVEEQELKVTHDNHSRGRGERGGYRGRGRGRGRYVLDGSTLECYNCHELGHFQWECPKKGQDSKVNYAETKEEMLLMAYMDVKEAGRDELWFLDSGCSNHMCGKKEIFSEYNDNFKESVKLGNNSRLTVQGKGNVRMEVNGIMQVITDVFYVPDLKNNLLSIGQLQEKGLAIIMQHNECKVFHPERGLIMETAMATNRMFIILGSSQLREQGCLISMTEDQPQLWHRRYGHLSLSGLKILQQKKMVKGLPRLKALVKVCEDRLVGKQLRDPFPKENTFRASTILQLVHADICGPISHMSNSKKRYLITFIDDYSRKTWVYFLVEKSEAFTIFKSYKARVEKETGACIRSLRTDRGGEFTSQEFTTFCNIHGIQRQLTSVYTPQQNGVAERKNRTIMNMVRSMLSEKKIPRTFWPEAVNWTIHVLNRSPTLVVRSMTLEEAWSGSKPSMEHFRVFGCFSHVHIPHNKRVKLDSKSSKCILLGVSEESKAYRLFNPLSQKIVISRDVVFEEDKAWD